VDRDIEMKICLQSVPHMEMDIDATCSSWENRKIMSSNNRFTFSYFCLTSNDRSYSLSWTNQDFISICFLG